ncbi:MAG TPA: Hpt domain-containing protein [Rhodanobacteraceae bacterium]
MVSATTDPARVDVRAAGGRTGTASTLQPPARADFPGLGWVKPQVDQLLSEARQALEAYAERSSDTASMQHCVTLLHQVLGTLRMVELHGAAELDGEMEQLAEALLMGRARAHDEALGTLMRGLLQLPDYLDLVEDGRKDVPVVLLPLLNELRDARGADPVDQRTLFHPELERPLPPDADGARAAYPFADLRQRVGAIRARFQVQLLAWTQGKPVDFAAMRACMDDLRGVCHALAARRLWWFAAAVLDALAGGRLDAHLASLRQEFSHLDRVIRQVQDQGEDACADFDVLELARGLLYYLAQALPAEGRGAAVAECFGLAELVPTAAELERARAAMSGRNHALLDTVAKAVREDLLRVKEGLDIFLRRDDRNPQQLAPHAETLQRVSDTLGVLGLDAPAAQIGAQRQVLVDIIDHRREAQPETILDVASGLLYVDASLEGDIQQLGEGDTADAALPRGEARRITQTLLQEAGANLAKVKQRVIAFVESSWSHAQLAGIPQLLAEVGGALRMLDFARPAALVDAVDRYVEDELVGARRVPAVDEMDRLADAVAALEYYLETGRSGNAPDSRILDGAQRSLEALHYWPVPARRVAAASAATFLPAAPPASVAAAAAGAAAADGIGPGRWVEVEEEVLEPVGDAAAPDLSFHEAAGIDAEIRDVFMEEVGDEIANINVNLPAWKIRPEDLDPLRNVRRSFHTLKGSGRLVGATALGEFSWKLENMLNRVLDGTIKPDANVQAVVDAAVATLPKLHAGLKGESVTLDPPLAAVAQAADKLAAGEPARVADFVQGYRKATRVVRRWVPRAEEPAVAREARDTVPQPVANAPVAALPVVDPALLDVLRAEVAQHLDGMRGYLARAGEHGAPVDAAFVRSVHTLHGAVAMVGIGALASVLAPMEVWVRRVRGAGGALDREGCDAVRDGIALTEHVLAQFDAPVPDVPDATALTERLERLRDRWPEADPLVAAHDVDEAASAAAAVGDLDAEGRGPTAVDHLAAKPAEQERAEQERTAAEKAEAERIAAERAEQERVEQERIAAENVEAERIAAERAEQERIAAERAELEHLAAEKAEQERIAAEKAEAERIAAERAEQERAEQERIAAEKVEAERIAAEQAEQERLAAEKAEQERIAAEKAEAERVAAERVEQERLAAEKVEQERLAAEKAEAERVAAERAEQERVAAEKAEAERIAAERAEQERLAAEKAEAERIAAERAEQERLAAEKAERERLAAEKAERERLAAEKAELERLAAEKAERERFAAARAAAERELAAAALPPFPADPQPEGALDLPDFDAELVALFTEEAGELLDASDTPLATLRNAPGDAASVRALQRNLHTFKGGARVVGVLPAGDLAHAMETLLERVGTRKRALNALELDSLERGFDRLRDLVERIQAGRAIAAPVNAIERFNALADGRIVGAPAVAAVAPVQPPDAPQAHEPAPAVGEAGAPSAAEIIRVRSDLLDALVNAAGEASIYRARLEQQVANFRFNLAELGQTVARVREQLRKLDIETEAQILSRYQHENEGSAGAAFDPLELDRFSNLQQYSRALAESVSDLASLQDILDDQTRQSETLLLQQSRVNSDLQDGLMRTRMLPFESLVPNLRRTLRGAADEVGKRARLQVLGAEGEMDRSVLERMKAPFEHMLRNALAHGIEAPAERVARGKPAEGTVSIRVSRHGTEVRVQVADDGAGFDRDAIRRTAIAAGLLQPDAVIADSELFDFVLRTGFSTASEVSQLAGRGVGMDVVANEIRQLGGSLAIESERGRGTTFDIRLPFTLAVTQAITVRAADTTFAIPMTSLQAVSRIPRADLAARLASDRPEVTYAGETYALHDLSALLGLGAAVVPEGGSGQVPLLMVNAGDVRAAVRIDAVVGAREIVVKPVGPQVSNVPGMFGATILGDGSVLLILDLAPLLRHHSTVRVADPGTAAGISGTLAEPPPQRRPEGPRVVMVVDDSITMRKVTRRVLEREELEVVTAKDGVDALEKLQERIPDVMLLDIEMPRMDGFELATHMKNDARFRRVPIIMITSRTGEKHRQRAFEIGVDRYLGKPYSEADLLHNVSEMLEARNA